MFACMHVCGFDVCSIEISAFRKYIQEDMPPVDSPEIFDVLGAYAPYENIPETALPPVLATGGLHDPRVGYWEPAKWVARLRDR